MIKKFFEYSGKKIPIVPYTTLIEKDILIITSIDENPEYDTVLAILGLDEETINSLTEYEKIVVLYEFRKISVGEEIPLKYKCKHCQQVNEINLNIENNIKNNDIKNTLIKDAFKPFKEEEIEDFLTEDISEMDIDEYEILVQEIKDSVTQFNFIKSVPCIKCTKSNNIDITDNLLDNMSEDSLMSIYQTYNDLNFHGSYTKQDIDSLYPFERTILIGLLNKTREELSK